MGQGRLRTGQAGAEGEVEVAEVWGAAGDGDAGGCGCGAGEEGRADLVGCGGEGEAEVEVSGAGGVEGWGVHGFCCGCCRGTVGRVKG